MRIPHFVCLNWIGGHLSEHMHWFLLDVTLTNSAFRHQVLDIIDIYSDGMR